MTEASLAVVLPVYNEADVIEEVVTDFYMKIIEKYPGSELIVAEDGSTDGTKEILSRLAERIPMKLVMGPERKGYLRGVRDALLLADAELVFFSDTDNTHDPSDFFKLHAKINEFDMVAGEKIKRNDPLYRIYASRAYNQLINVLFGVNLTDINAGFKLMRRSVVDKCVSRVKYLKYGFSTELVIRATHAGFSITGVPINHSQRDTGFSDQFEISNMPNVVKTQFTGLMKLRAELVRS